ACKDTSVACVEEKGNKVSIIVVQPKSVLAGTVTIRGDLANARASKPLPLTVSFSDGKAFEALRIDEAPGQKSTYHWDYDWKVGVPAPFEDDGYIYRLPYDESHPREVVQGYQGEYSHRSGTDEEFAVDFRMISGTKILAARGGKVI